MYDRLVAFDHGWKNRGTLGVVVSFLLLVVYDGKAQAFGIDDTSDVIDYGLFDSLWTEALGQGRLATHAVRSEPFRRLAGMFEDAQPQAYGPVARSAFWINAYLLCLWRVMDRSAGYRSTIWDSTLLRRDTFVVAGGPVVLHEMRERAQRYGATVLVVMTFATGSTHAPPFPARAVRARTWYRQVRDQARRVVRSERFVLYDPAGHVLQLAGFFRPYLDAMISERGSVVQFLLPYVSEAMAAALGLRPHDLRIVVSDRIERWVRRRG